MVDGSLGVVLCVYVVSAVSCPQHLSVFMLCCCQLSWCVVIILIVVITMGCRNVHQQTGSELYGVSESLDFDNERGPSSAGICAIYPSVRSFRTFYAELQDMYSSRSHFFIRIVLGSNR